MELPKLSCLQISFFFFFFFFFSTTIHQSFSARTLSNNHHHSHHFLTFYMQNFLTENHHPTLNPNSNPPFSKPLGIFPPNGGIPLPNPNPFPRSQTLDFPAGQTLSFPGVGMPFPARATLEELQVGMVTAIDESLFAHSVLGSAFVGKAKGVFVESSEDGSSHMMAVTATFSGSDYKDGLRFFGVMRSDGFESHIAVIGGTGKYEGANGYASVKVVSSNPNVAERTNEGDNKFLVFNVYLG